MSDNTAAFFEQLRASSARLLKLDPDDLSPSEQVRVDRCAALRLMLDRLQSQQLAGEAIDAKSYIAASSELERLFGSDPSAPPSRFGSGEAKERLRKLIEKTVMTPSAVEHEHEAAMMAREEFAAFLAAGGNADSWKPAPAGGSADRLAAVAPSAAGGRAQESDTLAAPLPAAPASPPLSDIESMNQTNAKAAEAIRRSGYLKSEPAWMDAWKRSPWSWG